MKKQLFASLALVAISIAGILALSDTVLAACVDCQIGCEEQYLVDMAECRFGPCAGPEGPGSAECQGCHIEAEQAKFQCLRACGPLCV